MNFYGNLGDNFLYLPEYEEILKANNLAFLRHRDY